MQTIEVVTSPAPVPLSAVSTPSSFQSPLIPIDTPAGKQLLDEVATVDHGPLQRWFERQEKLTFCSVASSCIAMNALLGYDALDQDKFFNKPTIAAIRKQSDVEVNGMTLAQLGSVLLEYRVAVVMRHVEDETLEEFRKYAITNLRRPNDFIVVNYRREVLGQNRGGHFSPLAAWHEASDRFLVLDTADYKYPAMWVPAAMLFAAMADVDQSSGRSRGYLAVSLS
jgi:hypothetical protein